MTTQQVNVKKLENLKELLTKAFSIYQNHPDLLNVGKEVKRKKWLLNRQKLVDLILKKEGTTSTGALSSQNFKQISKTIITDFKALQATIKKNLEDYESDEQDVKLVMAMVKRLEDLEEGYDSFEPTEQLKLTKFRDPVKKKVAPALGRMLKEVKKHLKVVDKAKANAPKTIDEARSQMNTLAEQLKAIRESLAAN